jgi:hypothetical protein
MVTAAETRVNRTGPVRLAARSARRRTRIMEVENAK